MSDSNRTIRPRRFSAIKPPASRAKRPEEDISAIEVAFPSDDDDPIVASTPEALLDDGETDAPDEGWSPVDPAAPAPAPAPSAKAATRAPSASVRVDKPSDEARIAKVMARAGLCSRRDAEVWIADGRVSVNGSVITSPALNVGHGDAVTVDGYPIDKPEKTRLFLFNKARGLVTTSRDPEGRPTIFDALPQDLPRLVTIGRLDINTEGLLLLTNDGGLARLLELPATGWIRRYRVRANGTIDQAQLDALAKGITVEGVVYAGIAAKLDRVQGANVWLTMGLKEGKNREIKRVLEHLGLGVTRLIRISFGPFQLGELGDNAVEEVRTRVLRDQLGTTLAKQAGVDFEGPEETEAPIAPVERPGRSQAPGGRGSRGTPSRGKAGDAGSDAGPRRQIRRTATEDRRGRAVTVERITTPSRARPSEARSDRPGVRVRTPTGDGTRVRDGARRPDDEGRRTSSTREAAPRSGARPDRPWALADGGRRAESRDAGPRFTGRDERESRPVRAPRQDARLDGRPARPPREGLGRGERTGPPRSEGARIERPSRDGVGRGERSGAPRSEPSRTGRPLRDGVGRGERSGAPRNETSRTERPSREGVGRGERSGAPRSETSRNDRPQRAGRTGAAPAGVGREDRPSRGGAAPTRSGSGGPPRGKGGGAGKSGGGKSRPPRA